MGHIPVLLHETIKVLDPKPGEFFVDGTAGDGGHLKEILARVGEKGKVLGIDLDPAAIERLRERFDEEDQRASNVVLSQGNYADLPEILENKDLGKADGLLLDLGFSSPQIEGSGRGFSFSRDEPLDMRYFPEEGRMSAADAVNMLTEKELADAIWMYGEERFSRRIARHIVEERRKKRITSTEELVKIVREDVHKSYERGRIHPATRTFQALRIYVNNELGNLEKILSELANVLVSGGRIAVISFHSLEDRIVKNMFRTMQKEHKLEILTKKPVTASKEEIAENSRSRSAKLRAARLL